MVRSLATVFAVFASFPAAAEEIPLKEIWALNMPGTLDVRELEPKRENEASLSKEERIKGSLVEHTRWALNSNFRPPFGNSARPGFVVRGTGLEALQAAHDVLTESKEREYTFPQLSQLTLVFYSYSCGRDVRLDSIEQQGKTVTVTYHFHAHNQRISRPQLALIPLSRVPAGKISVKFKRLPDTGREKNVKPLEQLIAVSTVCDSFTFGVSE